MAEELSSWAPVQGAEVLWGRCYEDDGAPPYWPWVQVVRAYLGTHDADEVRTCMGAGASMIAEMVPRVTESLGVLPACKRLNDAVSARFRLFDSITTFLERASADQPMVLVLDDLHWADTPSLMLFQFFAHRLDVMRLLVVGTYREEGISPSHPLHRTLAELERHRLSERIPLQRLEQDAIRQYVTEASGGNGIVELSGKVFEQSEGNPLFMSQIVRLLMEESRPVVDRATWKTPEGVQEVIGRRLGRLSRRCNHVLTTASVVGREFRLGLLRLLFEDLREDLLLEALEEALEAGTIVEQPGASETYRFDHLLTQQTIAAGLFGARKARLHARVAEAMEELFGKNAPLHAPEIAEQYMKAGTVAGSESAVRHLRIAGERALEAYAWEDALRFFSRGMEIRGDAPMDREMAALCLGRARTPGLGMGTAADQRDRVHYLAQAFDYYAHIGDRASAIRAARERIAPVVGDRTLRSILERALSFLKRDTVDYGWILERLADQTFFAEGDRVGAMAYYETATKIAEYRGCPDLLARALADWANMEYFAGSPQLVLELSHRAIELNEESGRLHSLRLAHGRACEAEMIMVGRYQDAVEHAVAQRSIGDRMHGCQGIVCMKFQIWYQLVGDWATARDYGDRALAAGDHAVNVLYYRVELECLAGDLVSARRYLAELRERWEDAETEGLTAKMAFTAQFAILAIAALLSATGENLYVPEAREAAMYLLSQGPRVAAQRRTLLLGGARLACATRDRTLAERCLAGLEAYEVPPFCLGDLAAAAHGAGFLGRAAETFEKAQAFYEEAGYRPYLAWNYLRYAAALAERGHSRDSAKAKELLGRAVSIAGALDMVAIKSRAEQQLSELNASGSEIRSGLTPREIIVLRHVTTGKMDKEIAFDLGISEHTVHNHVRSILAKLGVSNRTEAAIIGREEHLS